MRQQFDLWELAECSKALALLLTNSGALDQPTIDAVRCTVSWALHDSTAGETCSTGGACIALSEACSTGGACSRVEG